MSMVFVYKFKTNCSLHFYITKPVGGTGLGLTICYQIMEKHKGKIEVISQPEQGAELAIAIPCA